MNNVTGRTQNDNVHHISTVRNRTAVQKDSTLLRNGDYLYRMGDRLEGIYLVNVGTIKLYRITESGDQQIIGFYMPGEVIGLDALPDGISQTMAVALDTTRVTLIPFDTLLTGNEKFDSRELIRRMGKTLNRDNDLIMMLSQRTADRRLAWFLVEFSNNLAQRGLSPVEFTLPMSRTDISVFLGLALETVCRELARFCEKGLIAKGRRKFTLLDIEALRHLASGDEDSRAQPRQNVHHA